MPTRNVVLTDHHENLIEKLVRSGRYQNASEVLREGLRLVQQREAEDAEKLRLLRKAAKAGFDEIERGNYREIDQDDLAAFVASLGKQAAARSR
jgi:antitoxin ParD1/3/4